MTLERELALLVHDFATRVTELARRAALESMRTALAAQGPERLGLPVPPSAGRATARHTKRTGKDLRAAESALVEFLTSNPGLRVEQINQALGTETRELALPIRRLVASGVLRAQGQKRARRYSVAAGSPGSN